jgi:hypothetical protein
MKRAEPQNTSMCIFLYGPTRVAASSSLALSIFLSCIQYILDWASVCPSLALMSVQPANWMLCGCRGSPPIVEGDGYYDIKDLPPPVGTLDIITLKNGGESYLRFPQQTHPIVDGPHQYTSILSCNMGPRKQREGGVFRDGQVPWRGRD